MNNFNDPSSIQEALKQIKPLDEVIMKEALTHQHNLLKPAKSLGKLEDISVRIAGITGKLHNTTERKVHFLFGSDHGVFDEGISGSPQYFTKKLMEFYASGVGCGINVLCEHVGVELLLFDLGVKDLEPHPKIDASHRLMPHGTDNFACSEAMPQSIAERAISFGLALVGKAKKSGVQIVGTGEVGMGNTTPASACIMATLGLQDTEGAVGRGGGLTDEAFAHKKRVISTALKKYSLKPNDPIKILSSVGGLDIAAMVGVYIGAAVYRIPVVVDGLISIAAALLANKFSPLCKEFMFASHASKEPGYAAACQSLGLSPLVDLDMRLGEGTGCPIGMQIVDDALAIMNKMGTFQGQSLESEYREQLK